MLTPGTRATTAHTISLHNDILVYEDIHNYPLPVLVTRQWIYVGCHKISRSAWEALKKEVLKQEEKLM